MMKNGWGLIEDVEVVVMAAGSLWMGDSLEGLYGKEKKFKSFIQPIK